MAKNGLYVHPTGLGLAMTGGVVYLVCAAAVTLWRKQSIAFFNSWFHGIDLSAIATSKPIGAGTFFAGLISVLALSYLAGALFAWSYNKCVEHCKRWKWI